MKAAAAGGGTALLRFVLVQTMRIAGTAALWCVSAVAYGCESPRTLEVMAGMDTALNDWREYTVSGTQLLREQGWLSGPFATVQVDCGPWRFHGGIVQRGGTRDYDGQTNTGVPLQTHSTMSQTQGHAQILWDTLPQWSIGARLEGVHIARDIASTSTVSGYPEYYDWTLAALGTQWRRSLGTGVLSLEGWWGQALESRLQAYLPGKDKTTLGLGNISQTQAALRWRWGAERSWGGEVAWSWRRLEMDQGPSSAVTSNGVLSGSARQPRSVWIEMPVSASLRYRF